VTLAWVSTDARTGNLLADLPNLAVSSIKRSICRYESASATLPLPGAPENWLLATRHGGANLILLSDDVPIYGAMVTQRPRGTGDTLNLAMATIESYLDRRYVGDVTYSQVGQNDIIADLFAKFVVIGPRGGIPFRVVYTTPGAGTLRDRSYLRSDRKTIYSVLTELSAALGGPEWTAEWEWSADHSKITPVLFVGDRVGTAMTPGLMPTATFQAPGCIIEAVLVEDYSAGKGANSVIAYSSAVANVVPESPAQVAADDGRPTFETDIQPSTSISVIATLTGHAQSALASLAPGGSALTMSADYLTSPPLGSAWVLGDDVGYQIGGLEVDPHNPAGRQSVPAFPNGISGVMRAFGWELSLEGVQVVTPTLVSTGA